MIRLFEVCEVIIQGLLRNIVVLLIALQLQYPAFAQTDVDELGQDRPEDRDLDEDFHPRTINEKLMYVLKARQTANASAFCYELGPSGGLRYYHAFAEHESVTGSSIFLGLTTEGQYKTAFSLPTHKQNYSYGQKSYWEPVSYAYPDLETYLTYLDPPPQSDQDKELARTQYVRDREQFLRDNPEGEFVGWIRWVPILYGGTDSKHKIPLKISDGLAGRMGLPNIPGVEPYVVHENFAVHNPLIERYGFDYFPGGDEKVMNNVAIKPVVYLGKKRTGLFSSRPAFYISYEMCVNPTAHRIEGDFSDLYQAESERIDEMIEEGSVFFVNPASFYLQPPRYIHPIDDAPVQLAYWTHLRGRLLTLEQKTHQVDLAILALKTPGYFFPLTSVFLAGIDFYHCKQADEPLCLAALAFDGAAAFTIIGRIPAVSAKLTNGAMKATKIGQALRKELALGQAAELYATGIVNIVRANPAAAALMASAGGNITLAGLYLAEGDVKSAYSRVIAAGGDATFSIIFRAAKSSVVVPIGKVESTCEATGDITKNTKTLSSNIDTFQSCPLGVEHSACASYVTSADDIQTAERLAFKVYSESGIINPANFPDGKFRHAATLTNPHQVIALGGSDPHRAMTVIADGTSPLPIEAYFPAEVANLRSTGSLVEFSTLVGSKSGCVNQFDELFEVMGKGLKYAIDNNARYIVIGAHPKHLAVYRRSFGMQPYSEVLQYGILNNVDVQLGVFDVDILRNETTRETLFRAHRYASTLYYASQGGACPAP